MAAYNSIGESAKSAAASGATSGCPTTTAMAAPYLYLGWGDPPSGRDRDVGDRDQAVHDGVHALRRRLRAGVGQQPAADRRRRPAGDQPIRANGGDIQISFGGWSGNKLGPNCSSAAALAGAYQQVINAYNLKYIDIDIENTDEFENETVQDRILSALKIVKQNNPGIKTIITFGTAHRPARPAGAPA